MSEDRLYQQHERRFKSNRFVYPVLSRRAQGISIGVNLNPDKACNFDCIYCQVDRRTESDVRFVETDRLLEELRWTLEVAASGSLYGTVKFAGTPEPLRRINDIAFSGDGEPTTFLNFPDLMRDCAAIKDKLGLDDVKMVLITNASMFHKPRVQAGLETLDANNGEIWAKLDAGTDEYYRLICRAAIPFSRILENIRQAAVARPIVIQSLFMRVDGVGPDDREIREYCGRLNDISAAGGRFKLVQVYSIARDTAEDNVLPLDDTRVDEIVDIVASQTGLPVAGYYGTHHPDA